MKEILVAGLGSGSFAQLTCGVWEILKNSKLNFLRTAKHPVVEELTAKGICFRTFDALYENKDDFAEVYEGIVAELWKKIQEESVDRLVYAVPGHPLVGEKSVQLLLKKAEREGDVKVTIYEGISFVDSILNLLQIDLTVGFSVLDALNVQKGSLNLVHHQIFTQVYNRYVASELKLVLLELYPPEHRVTVIKAAGIKEQEEVRTVVLSELDHRAVFFDHLTSVYVPPLPVGDTVGLYPLDPLVSVLDRLLAPDGCPWDKEQTHLTLKRCLLEETYEVVEAIDDEDMEQLKEELGDLLLQVVFHAALAERSGAFDLNGVVGYVTEKMIRRHPHVFGETIVKDASDVLVNWEEIKKAEKGHDRADEGVLGKINKALPALLLAEEVQKKAGKCGFDWHKVTEPIAKVKEELQELIEEINSGEQKKEKQDEGEIRDKKANSRIEDELGDLLFAAVNVARFVGVSSEAALYKAIRRFMRRFKYIEGKIDEKGLKWGEMDLKSLDIIWEEAKSIGL